VCRTGSIYKGLPSPPKEPLTLVAKIADASHGIILQNFHDDSASTAGVARHAARNRTLWEEVSPETGLLPTPPKPCISARLWAIRPATRRLTGKQSLNISPRRHGRPSFPGAAMIINPRLMKVCTCTFLWMKRAKDVATS
jgi:hypothetical protein